MLALTLLAAIALGAPATAWHRAQAATAPQRHLPILIGSNVIGFSSRSAGTAEGDARLAAAGVRLIRFDMLWSQVERQRGVFDFSALDARVSAAQAAGLEVLAILD